MVAVKGGTKKKIVKSIRVDADKCTGCRSCELACAAFHAVPKYSSVNPARARIRVMVDERNNVYVPIRAGDYTPAECMGRDQYTIDGKEYDECAFCRASCPSRAYFKEPDTGLPLVCDMCEDAPPLSEPMCVQVCDFDALTYEEREEEGEEQVERGDLEIGLESLANTYGFRKIMEVLARMAMKR
jgi:benzoyl-CoA reductase subunit BamC